MVQLVVRDGGTGRRLVRAKASCVHEAGIFVVALGQLGVHVGEFFRVLLQLPLEFLVVLGQAALGLGFLLQVVLEQFQLLLVLSERK